MNSFRENLKKKKNNHSAKVQSNNSTERAKIRNSCRALSVALKRKYQILNGDTRHRSVLAEQKELAKLNEIISDNRDKTKQFLNQKDNNGIKYCDVTPHMLMNTIDAEKAQQFEPNFFNDMAVLKIYINAITTY